jgi:substrate import-associated zinc metallohydrolase lipoprotein
MVDSESNFTYTLVPASITNSIKVAHIVLHTWLEAYDEVAGQDFTRQLAPKVLQFIGSPAMESDNRGMMGQAESGMKITLFGINQLEITKEFLNNTYFQSMHHEFTHILAQNKDYDTDFQKISEGQYEPANWYAAGKTETYALQKGFISTYAMSEYNEDFAETLAFYLIYTQAEWDAKMKTADGLNENSEQCHGSVAIMQKLQMIRSYMQTVWDIDIDELRSVIQRRMNEVVNGQVDLMEL